MDSIAVILLAAGSSRRMGKKNKLLLPYRGQPMVLHQTQQIIAAGMKDNLIVVLGHQAAEVKAVLPAGVVTVFNPDHSQGMTSSIQAGVRAADEHASGYMICLSDMPLLNALDYQKISRFFSDHCKAAPGVITQPVFYQKNKNEKGTAIKKQPGHPLVLSAVYKKEILAHTAPEGCREIICANHKQVKQLEMGPAILWDVDTEEDWLKI